LGPKTRGGWPGEPTRKNLVHSFGPVGVTLRKGTTIGTGKIYPSFHFPNYPGEAKGNIGSKKFFKVFSPENTLKD